LYDEECNYLTTIKLDDPQDKYPQFTSKLNIYDKELKYPDDAAIKIDLTKCTEDFPAHHILFMIRVKNLS
jgi:hypothetical protein